MRIVSPNTRISSGNDVSPQLIAGLNNAPAATAPASIPPSHPNSFPDFIGAARYQTLPTSATFRQRRFAGSATLSPQPNRLTRPVGRLLRPVHSALLVLCHF